MKTFREQIAEVMKSTGEKYCRRDVAKISGIEYNSVTSVMTKMLEAGEIIKEWNHKEFTYRYNPDYKTPDRSEFFCTSCQNLRSSEGSKRFTASNGIVRQKCLHCVRNEKKRRTPGRKPKPKDFEEDVEFENREFLRQTGYIHA